MIIQLHNDINCQKICKLIEKMLASYSKKGSMENKAIAINIVDIVENLPKIEHKNETDGINEDDNNI